MPTVLARRIVAVSPDQAFGQQLATGLQAVADTVDVHRSLDSLGSLGPGELQAALCVIHLEGERAHAPSERLPRLTGGCPVIAVIPRSNLAAVVDLMQSSDHIAATMVAEDFDPRELSALATRMLTDDRFGLEQVMASGTQIHARTVGDYEERSLCMSRISEFVEQVGVPHKYRAPIEQCVDEMLMNALYDAPVDAQGKHIFSGIPTRTRITLRSEQRVVVQYASDGKQFAVSVRDAFGTLERPTVLRYLHKGLHAEQQIDRKAGGAGLGLYLMANSATAVYFNVLPGIATEALCMFDLEAPKLSLEQFGFLVQIDAGGRRAAGPARRLPAARHRRGLVRSGMIVGIVVLLGILAWARGGGGAAKAQVTFTTIPQGATIEIEGRTVGTTTGGPFFIGDLEIGRAYPVVARLDGYEAKSAVVQPHAGANEVTFELQALATVELDSEPTGAAVEIDGKPMGSTPLTLTSLVPGQRVSIVFKRTGYRAATARLQIPGAGSRQRLVQPLEVSDEFVRVHFVSNPPGAEILEHGQPATVDRTYTPANVFVEANEVQRFTLTMPKHVPLVIEPFTAGRGAHELEKGGDLVEGATLRIEASIDGKLTVAGAPHCQDVASPFDCMLAPGTYVVEYLGPNNARVTRRVTMAARDAIEKFELGVIEAGPGKLLQPGGLRKAVFEVGMRTVTVSDMTGTHRVTVSVTSGTTVIVN
jgi:hypothetical protein